MSETIHSVICADRPYRLTDIQFVYARDTADGSMVGIYADVKHLIELRKSVQKAINILDPKYEWRATNDRFAEGL